MTPAPAHRRGDGWLASTLVITLLAASLAASMTPPHRAAGIEPGPAEAVTSFLPFAVESAPPATATQPVGPMAGVPTSEPELSACAPGPLAAVTGAAGSPSSAPAPASVPLTTKPTPDRRPVLPVGTADSPVRAVFLGDSYTTGWNGFGLGSAGWPAIVAKAHHWTVVNLAVAGTGFVNPGWTSQPLSTRIAAAVKARPDVLFVASGHNDRRYGAVAASGAARIDLDRLRKALPHTLIVVIAPIWADGRPPASVLGLRDALRAEAKTIDALFLDPLGGGWFSGTNHRLIGADGIHPTDAGHRHIARLVQAFLDRATRAPGPAPSSQPAASQPAASQPATAPTPSLPRRAIC